MTCFHILLNQYLHVCIEIAIMTQPFFWSYNPIEYLKRTTVARQTVLVENSRLVNKCGDLMQNEVDTKDKEQRMFPIITS